MRKTLRILLICALVVAMSVNPASAWHWFRGRGCGGYASYGWGSHYSSYYGGCGSYGGYYGGYYSYAPASYYGGGCGDCGGCGYGHDGGYGYADGCGCGGEVSGVIEADGSYMHEGTVIESAPVVPEEAAPSTRRMPPPQDGERSMTTTPRPELPPEPMPEDTEPATTEPADDLFAPDTEEPRPPATEPEATTPTTPPPTTPVTPPAEETEDIFGTEPAETNPPATTPSTPAETPATETDDLFGTSATEEAASTPPQTEPATEESTGDDLFGTEPTDATEGAATPPTSGTDATEEAPAEGAPTDDATEEDNIFDTSKSILREPGGIASAELRTWVDNTGKHSCRGRLVLFLDGKVRILKDNGRTTTVPLYRLSTNDLSFVNRQASAQETVEAGQVAQTPSPEPLAAN